LKGAHGHGDEAHGQVEAGEPGGGCDQVSDVLVISLDLRPTTDAANARDQANGRIWGDHIALRVVVVKRKTAPRLQQPKMLLHHRASQRPKI
jgi:hypothetical protein